MIFAFAIFAVALLILSAVVFGLLAMAGKMLAAPDFNERESRHV